MARNRSKKSYRFKKWKREVWSNANARELYDKYFPMLYNQEVLEMLNGIYEKNGYETEWREAERKGEFDKEIEVIKEKGRCIIIWEHIRSVARRIMDWITGRNKM